MLFEGDHNLEVRCSVWPAAGVMILFQVRLERGALVRVGRLVADGRARPGHEVVVVFGIVLLAAPDAPADDGDAAEEDGTSNTAYNSADYFLGGTEAGAAGITATTVKACSLCRSCEAGGCGDGPAGDEGLSDGLATAYCGHDGSELLNRGRYER